MKTTQLIAAAALSILAAAGAQAETYQGVQQVHSVRSRAEVGAEGAVAARAGNVFGDAAAAGVQPVLNASTSRSAVNAQAVAAAHEANQNINRSSFLNSRIPSTMSGATAPARQAGL